MASTGIVIMKYGLAYGLHAAKNLTNPMKNVSQRLFLETLFYPFWMFGVMDAETKLINGA